MKNILILPLLFLSIQVFAQDNGVRPYTKEEIARLQTLCSILKKCAPSTYKGFSVAAKDCGNMNGFEKDNSNNAYTAMNAKKQAIGNLPYYNITFTNKDDSIEQKQNEYTKQIATLMAENNAANKEEINKLSALASKFAISTEVSLSITTSISSSYEIPYYYAAKPKKVDIAGASFSNIYTFPEGKVVLDENGDLLDTGNGRYVDHLFVVFGPLPTVQIAFNGADGKSTWREDKIVPKQFSDLTLMGPIKTIIVQIDGNEADIKNIIKQIDWNALQAMLNK